MSVNHQHAMTTQEISQGVILLKKRQRNLMLLCIFSTSMFVVAAIGLYLEQDLIYSFFGLSNQVYQLHIPVSVEGDLANWGKHPDYFMSLLSWFGWLILKVVCAFFGAFIAIGILKKLRYFAHRFQSFVLKFVAWLIAFILIWSGMSYWQHEINDDQDQAYRELVYYDQTIHNSVLARELAAEQHPNAVTAYLMAQMALLHKPADLSAAKPYIHDLIRAEKEDPQFERYGFKAEQIRAMQLQILNKVESPLARAVEPKIVKADQIRVYFKNMLLVLLGLSFILSAIFYLLFQSIKKRTLKIQQRILY